MLSTHIGVLKLLGFLGGEIEHLFHARRIRDVSDLLLVRPCADLFLDLKAHGLKI